MADITSKDGEKYLIAIQRPSIKMFEPECQNIDCPQCLLGKIYFDRDIGYYCMLCGLAFSNKEMQVLIEKMRLTCSPAKKSQSDRKKPIVQIRELPTDKTKAKRFSRNIIEPEKPES